MPATITLTGTAIDQATEQGLRDLEVQIWPTQEGSTSPLATAVTNDSGKFVVELALESSGLAQAIQFKIVKAGEQLELATDEIKWGGRARNRTVTIPVSKATTKARSKATSKTTSNGEQLISHPTQLRPIALNEQSYNVTLLHQSLKALGVSVSETEVAEGKAGTDTLEKVRSLQAQLKVPIDDSTLVDENTALAIADALDKRGLTKASNSFTVKGTVRLSSGEVKKRQYLRAYDLDLKAVAVFRTVKTLGEIQENGGFEFLGETYSNSLGTYRLTFYGWQYAAAERKKADVVVYAVDDENVTGYSQMVNSEDYAAKGLAKDVDVEITKEETRTEYQVLMEALEPFLQESQTTLYQIATSSDQLSFTSSELDLSLLHLEIAADAQILLVQEDALSHELLYGLGRQNMKLTWTALYKKQEAQLRAAIAKSVEAKIISAVDEKTLDAFLALLQETTAKYLLDDSQAEGANTLNAMLSNALPEEAQRLSFVKAVNSFTGSDYSEFWATYLSSQPEFENHPELISSLLMTQRLTRLTGNNQKLVGTLQSDSKVSSPRDLIALEKDDWVEIVKRTGVPDFIQGDTDDAKIDQYVDLMMTTLNAAYPTERIAVMVDKGEVSIEKTSVSKAISNFLSSTADFDVARSRVFDFDEQLKSVAGEDFDETRSELMKLQRVFQVSPSPEAMTTLLTKKLHSAYTISNIPRKTFIKTYGEALGGADIAEAVHLRATHISTKTEFIATRLMENTHDLTPGHIRTDLESKAALTTIENKVPNYTDLFGSPDMCECEECESVYGAAAYLVDLLKFLSVGSPGDAKTPLAVLSERRPDLLYLPLTCENTDTLIPYVDLALEVMEYYTANGGSLPCTNRTPSVIWTRPVCERFKASIRQKRCLDLLTTPGRNCTASSACGKN